jgi:hypothetical protein
MTWTIEAAFTGGGIEKYEPTHEGYSFWLKGISTEIKVVLSINGAHGGFNFRTSHIIKTPKQIAPYHPGRPWGDYPEYALRQAVTSITQHYDYAIKSGLSPEVNWLIDNN